MSQKLSTLRQQFLDKLKLLRAFGVAQSLLSWDRETHMPKGAAMDRGEAMAVIAGFSHQLFVDKEFVKVVNSLADMLDELTLSERRAVSLTKKELDKACKLSKEFVEETNEITNASYTAWVEAKHTNNFALFAPHLEKVVENRKKYAALLDKNNDPYDVLLDDYEEGLTITQLQPLFSELKSGIVELLPQVMKRQKKVKNPLNNIQVNHHQMREFLNEMVSTVGFDLQRGTMGNVEHPFEISISANDVRLNTRFDKDENSFTIMGMIHELGHGLYEQNVDSQYRELGLDHGVSLGVHESQSRLLENMIGRSPEFWQYFLPILKAKVPELKKIDLTQLVAALNQVEPSLIRTEADEVTYNLHIILRFELEQDLMHGRVQVKDLPEVWQTRMKEMLGITPATDSEGVLQDVHWAWGNLGYFPTYSVGNLNAGQLFAAFEKAHPNWRSDVEKGDFTPYFDWMKHHIWQHGSFYTPAELMKKATGEKQSAQPFLSYLKKKYLT